MNSSILLHIPRGSEGPRKNNSVAPRASLGLARKARFEGNGHALAKKCKVADVVQGRPNAGIYSCAGPKSRQALDLLQQRDKVPSIRDYLKQPLSKDKLTRLLSIYPGDSMQLARQGEVEFAASGLASDSDPAAITAALEHYPRLLHRPVLFNADQAIIGRPPERIIEPL